MIYVDNSFRAPRKAYLFNYPYQRARTASEIYEKVEYLQTLYERFVCSFDNVPLP